MRQRVLVVDDNPLARQAVASVLGKAEEFDLVGEASGGLEALKLARELMPDLILMDINMPEYDGLLTTRLIKRELPYITVVILTVSDDAGDLFEAIKSGAQGYLLKSLNPDDWLQYLRDLARGDRPISKDLARRMISEFTAASSPEPDMRLTDREQEVLELVAQALTNKQIAAALYISEQTVKNHLKNMMHKLHLKSRVELALHARRTAAADRSPGER